MSVAESPPQVLQIPAAEVLPLRARILRAGRPMEQSIYPGDDAPTTVHLGIRDPSGRLIACGTFLREPFHGETAWRLRGMAVDSTAQLRRLGSTLLGEAERRLLQMNDAELLWCNARGTAIGFYQRLGWSIAGEPRIIDDLPHVEMIKRFRSAPFLAGAAERTSSPRPSPRVR